jgi:molybdopterin adenylyltransferase
MKYNTVVITVSDSCFRGEREDLSGPELSSALTAIGFEVSSKEIVPDDLNTITSVLRKYVSFPQVHLIVTTGGTGFSMRDVTPEATRQVIDRPADGLAEFVRFSGASQTEFSWLSRGEAGIAGSTLILNLPGSQKAMHLIVDALKNLLFHALNLLNGQESHKP